MFGRSGTALPSRFDIGSTMLPQALNSTLVMLVRNHDALLHGRSVFAKHVQDGPYSTFGPLPASGVTSSTRARPLILAGSGVQSFMQGSRFQKCASLVWRSSS